ncbi:DUF2142 domain-containing protein [Rhodopseudomonas boonkerdii]|uniref:DUF2142 domain-containing protein n=1 Tax=Rhodopseudomonas boonkerdii TaxID=475937 RepID=UPI003D320452
MGHPAYAPMAALLGLANGASRIKKTSAIALVWILVLARGSFAVIQAGTPSARPDAHIDPAAQFRWVMGDPLAFIKILASTISIKAPGYASSFIGRLGWLDVYLSRGYLAAAFGCLLCGSVATINPRMDARGLVVFVATMSILLVFSSCAVFATLHDVE